MTVTVNEQTREIFPPRVRRPAGIKIGTGFAPSKPRNR